MARSRTIDAGESGRKAQRIIRFRRVEEEVGSDLPAEVYQLQMAKFGELLRSGSARGTGMQADEIRRVSRVLSEYQPMSGVQFGYSPNIGFYAEGSEAGSDPNIGGAGITRKNLLQHDLSMPGFAARLRQETGKIVLLGNGFSDLGVVLAQRHAIGASTAVPVVVDMLDYGLVLEDLRELSMRVERRGLSFPFIDDLQTLEGMRQMKASGDLKIVRHYFGGSQVMDENMRDASMAVNLFGPPFCTVSEQLDVLAPGGELWLATYVPEGLGARYSIRPFPLPELQGKVPIEHPARLLWGCVIERNREEAE